MLAQPPDQEQNLFACKTACDRSSRRPSANATTKTRPLFGTENRVTLQECICYPLTAVYARGTSSGPRLLRVGLNESFCLDSSYARGGVLCATNDGTYRHFNDGRLPQTHGVEAHQEVLSAKSSCSRHQHTNCWAISAAFFDESQPVLPPTPDRKKLRTGLPHPQR